MTYINNKICQAVMFVLLLAATMGTAAQEEQTWRMTAKGADIHEFVAQVADITGKTFVIDPRLKGNVTVISETPMDKDAVYALFLSVLRLHNFTAVPSGDIIRIQQNATGKQTPGTKGDSRHILQYPAMISHKIQQLHRPAEEK